uniref:Nucleotide-diphospho-sugar transferase domain-containing protein n=1 Tax=Tetraselmis sp. GSL018 TaxID=582737 RepID=A0A061R496_9CHLO
MCLYGCVFFCYFSLLLTEYARCEDKLYSKYATTGKDQWPRPKRPELKEKVYFGDISIHESRLALHRKYLSQASQRRRELKWLLRDSDVSKPVIAMIVNWGQIHMFLNWVCGLKAEGMGPLLQQSLVFTGDNDTFNALRHILPTYFVSSRQLPGLPSSPAKVFGDRTFGSMMVLKVAAVYSIVMELGRDLLFQDVDVVWNQNPVPLFYETRYKHKDALFSYDGNVNQPPFYFNAGFFFIRSTPKGKLLAEDFFYYFSKRRGSAVQPILNQVLLHHYLVYGLDMEILSTAVVPHPADERLRLGGTLKKELDGVSPLVIHAAWTHNHWDKVKKLRAVGRWWLNDTCEHYHTVKPRFSVDLRDCIENSICDRWKLGSS